MTSDHAKPAILPTPVVLGSGSNAYGLVRSMALAGIRPIVADSRRGPAFVSRLTAQRWLIDPPGRLSRHPQSLIDRLASLPSGAFLIPTNEPWVDLLNRHRRSFGTNVHLALARPDVVDLVLCKTAMFRWCDRHDIAQPESRAFHPGDDWDEFLTWAMDQSPVIVKPDTKGIGDESLGFPTAEFHDPERLRNWGEGFSPNGPPCPILAQRFISGPGVALAAWHGFRSADGALFMAGITKLRSRPPRLGGCTTAARFEATPASRDAAVDLLERLGYSGFFDLEFIVRPGDAPPLFVELNPRPGMPNYAATAMGVNLPLLGMRHSLGLETPSSLIVTNLPGVWVDMSSDPWLALSGSHGEGRRLGPRQWLESLRPGPVVDAYFNPRDPLVFLSACARLGVLGLRHLLNRASAASHPPGPGAGKGLAGKGTGLKSRVGFFFEQARNIGPMRMVAASTATRFRRELVFLQQDLRGPLPRVPGFAGLSCHRLRRIDGYLLQEVNPTLDRREVIERFDQGQRCWLFRLHGRPVHYRWEVIESTYLDYLRATLTLADDEIMHQAVFTHRDYRRRGIAARAAADLLARSQKEGFRRMIIAAAWWNKPALNNMIRKSRMRPLGSAVLWGVGPFTKLSTNGDVAVNNQGDLYIGIP